jgi:hypothetical protein
MAETTTNRRGVIVPKARSTIYTWLLGVAALALTVGCLLLLFETAQFGNGGIFDGLSAIRQGPG